MKSGASLLIIWHWRHRSIWLYIDKYLSTPSSCDSDTYLYVHTHFGSIPQFNAFKVTCAFKESMRFLRLSLQMTTPYQFRELSVETQFPPLNPKKKCNSSKTFLYIKWLLPTWCQPINPCIIFQLRKHFKYICPCANRTWTENSHFLFNFIHLIYSLWLSPLPHKCCNSLVSWRRS